MSMRNFVIGCGIMVVLSIIGFAIGPGEWVFSTEMLYLENECKFFVDTAVVAVAKEWDTQELIKRIDPEMLQPGDEEKVEKLFGLFRKLGTLVEYHGSEVEVFEYDSGETGFSCTAEADFENGSGTITVDVVQIEGGLYIESFNIRSETFLADL